jgi:hypothetical protein
MILLALSGCKSPAPAPTDLSDLARFFFREHHAEDSLLGEGADNLAALIEGVDPDAPAVERAYTLGALSEEDVAGITRPDGDPADCAGLAVADRSPWPLSEHLAYRVLSDLAETSLTASVYDRTFDVADPACFLDQSCTEMRTDNLIYRDTLLLSIEYRLVKEYRWITTETHGDAVIARGWIETEAHGESGANHIYQNYEIDLYIPDGTDTLRLYGVWTASDYAGLDEDTAYSLSMNSTADALKHLDDWIADQQ